MAARPHRWSPVLLWTALALAIALLVAAGYGWQQWLRVQQERGIVRLDWQGLELTHDGLRLRRLQLEQRLVGRHLQATAEGIELGWRLQLIAPPHLTTLNVQRLQLDWRADSAAPPAGERRAAAGRQRLQELLAWLPPQVRVADFSASLPCASGQCRLQGAAELSHGGAAALPLEFVLRLQRPPHEVQLRGRLQGAAQDLALQLDLALDGQAQAQLHSRLTRNAAGRLWQGRLVAPELPDAAWLHAWLGEWQRLPEQPLPPVPRSLQAQADWQLQLAGDSLELDNLLHGDGRLQLELHLPTPWPVPELGQLHGQLQLELHGRGGQWQARRLQADLQLEQAQGAWLQRLPAGLRPQALQLRLQPLAGAPPPAGPGDDTPLALQLELSSRGALQLELAGTLQARLRPDWALQLREARLQASATRLPLAPFELRDLQGALQLDATLDRRSLAVQLLPGSQLRAERLDVAAIELRLERLRGELAGLQLQAEFPAGAEPDWRLHGPLQLRAERLQQAQLQPRGWRWQGRLEATAPALRLDGRLDNDAGLALDLQLQRPSGGAVQLQARLADLDLADGNPLARTLRAWPALLELERGQLKASGSLQLATGRRALAADLAVQLQEVGGIFGRAELVGLQASPRLQLRGQRLDLEIPDLRLARLNPGVPLGALRLRADYRAERAQPLAGRLQLWQADGALLGGQLRLRPVELDLARRPLALTLQVRGLELAELLKVYPAEGLSGSGTLDGELPLRRDRDGWHIDAGQLAARAPGGVLQLRSARIRAFGRSNPPLRYVAAALENFRYDRLETQVSYAPQGQLLLSMRLHGSNPALEGGRPVNLNVNLEEDIPSLMTSLQLSGRVNQAIQRRVQQRLQLRD